MAPAELGAGAGPMRWGRPLVRVRGPGEERRSRTYLLRWSVWQTLAASFREDWGAVELIWGPKQEAPAFVGPEVVRL